MKDITTEQEYQRDYYLANKQKRTKKLRDKWNNDPRWRAQEQERAQQRRGRLRAAKAKDRFYESIVTRRKNMAATAAPRWALVDDKSVQVWDAGSLGREVGRSARAIRSWLCKGVLPGASLYISKSSFFSRQFCGAVYRACERLYYLDGRGDHTVLKRLVREELAKGKVSFVPVGGDNETDRTVIDE